MNENINLDFKLDTITSNYMNELNEKFTLYPNFVYDEDNY